MKGPYKVVESEVCAGHYHLASLDDCDSLALCGYQTVLCAVPLRAWGSKSPRTPVSYCCKCELLAAAGEEE